MTPSRVTWLMTTILLMTGAQTPAAFE
jgi:hypothetical protein